MKTMIALLLLIFAVGGSVALTQPVKIGLIGDSQSTPVSAGNGTILINDTNATDLASSDGADRFMSVSGGFARAWLADFLSTNEAPVKGDMTNDLWSWGGVPMGKKLVDGKLVSVNNTTAVVYNDWLGTGQTPVIVNNGIYAPGREGEWDPGLIGV